MGPGTGDNVRRKHDERHRSGEPKWAYAVGDVLDGTIEADNDDPSGDYRSEPLDERPGAKIKV